MCLTSPLQILVELADRQDHEVGDGTTSVVILAAELLKVSALGKYLVWIMREVGCLCYVCKMSIEVLAHSTPCMTPANAHNHC